MKIRGVEWMDWLHLVRSETQKQRKRSHRSMAKYLKKLEGKPSVVRQRPANISKAIKGKAMRD